MRNDELIDAQARDRFPGSKTRSPELEFSLIDILIGLLRRRRVFALAILIPGVVAYLVSFLVPTRYTSTTRLMPPQQSQSIANQILGQLGPLAGLAGKDMGGRNPSELYVALLKSETLEDSIIQHFNLMQVYRTKLLVDTRRKLDSRVDAVASKEGIITISVTDGDPKRASEMATALVEGLYKLNQTLAVSEAAQRRMFYEQQLDAEKNKLSEAEVSMARTQQSSGLLQLDSQARATIEQNSRLEAELAATQVQLRSMQSFATTENAQYVKLQEQVAALEAQLAKNKSKQGPGKNELGTGTLPQLGVDYLRRLRELKYHEAIYELLLRQLEVAKIDEAKSASVIQVLDKPQVPERRSSPRRLGYFAGGMLLGGFIALVWTFFAEFSERARTHEELGPKVEEIRNLLKPSSRAAAIRDKTTI